MTLVLKTSRRAPSLRVTGMGPLTPHSLVIAHLGLADTSTTHEEGNPDYRLWVGSPHQQDLQLAPDGLSPGLLLLGCSLKVSLLLDWERASWELPAPQAARYNRDPPWESPGELARLFFPPV